MNMMHIKQTTHSSGMKYSFSNGYHAIVGFQTVYNACCDDGVLDGLLRFPASLLTRGRRIFFSHLQKGR